jgi:hypothetical protein
MERIVNHNFKSIDSSRLFSFNQAGRVPIQFALKLAVFPSAERIFRATVTQL